MGAAPGLPGGMPSQISPPSRWSAAAAGPMGGDNSSVDGDSMGTGRLGSYQPYQPPVDGDYFSPESMTERMRSYIQAGGIPQEFVERYAEELRARRAAAGGGAAAGGLGPLAGLLASRGGGGGVGDADSIEAKQAF